MEFFLKTVSAVAIILVVVFVVAWLTHKINNVQIPRQSWENCMLAKMYERPDSVYPIADRLCKQRGAD